MFYQSNLFSYFAGSGLNTINSFISKKFRRLAVFASVRVFLLFLDGFDRAAVVRSRKSWTIEGVAAAKDFWNTEQPTSGVGDPVDGRNRMQS